MVCRNQSSCVLMDRRGEDILGESRFDDLTFAHDDDPIADVTHQVQIVGNDGNTHTGLSLNTGQKIEYPPLN